MLNHVFKMPEEGCSRFGMIDIGNKRPTRRVAVAMGRIIVGDEAFDAIQKGTLPKGDVLALAEAAAIAGAKNTPIQVPMCHTVPLDMAGAHFLLDAGKKAVDVIVQCVATAKTGVEMEALAGVNAALLTIWDLTKGTNPALRIEDIRLLVKTGGKSGIWINPEGVPSWLQNQIPDLKPFENINVAVLVMSDRAASGAYEDTSGEFLKNSLIAEGGNVVTYEVISDDYQRIVLSLRSIQEKYRPDVILASGGTGPGGRDVTPEALKDVCDVLLEGMGEWLRHESGYFTPTAWLSRMGAGMMNNTLIIALPGSLKAVTECWQILSPVLPIALERIAKQNPGQASQRKKA